MDVTQKGLSFSKKKEEFGNLEVSIFVSPTLPPSTIEPTYVIMLVECKPVFKC